MIIMMKHTWRLAWLCPLLLHLPVLVIGRNDSDFSDDLIEKTSSDTIFDNSEARSLQKRQLDFEGGGGGVNKYVNGDGDDYNGFSDQYEDIDKDVDFWRMPNYDDVLESDFDPRPVRRKKLEYQLPNRKYKSRGKQPRNLDTGAWVEPKEIETVTNEIDQATINDVTEKNDISDTEQAFVQYQEDNQERNPVNKLDTEEQANPLQSLDLLNIGEKIHETIKTGIKHGRKTIEDGLTKIEDRLNKIKRSGKQQNGIDLKVIKSKPPPRPPIDELSAPVLRPGPPYDDQTLIQKFINDEIEREQKWQAKQHVKPMQGRFKNLHPNEIEEEPRAFKSLEPPPFKSFEPPPPPKIASTTEKSSSDSKGGVFRNFISNLVQKSIIEGTKRKEVEEDIKDSSEEITIDLYTTKETKDDDDEDTTTILYYSDEDFITDEDNEVTTNDPFRFNPSPKPNYFPLPEDSPQNIVRTPMLGQIEKISKPMSSGWQNIRMNDVKVNFEYKHPEHTSLKTPAVNSSNIIKGRLFTKHHQNVENLLKPPPRSNSISMWDEGSKSKVLEKSYLPSNTKSTTPVTPSRKKYSTQYPLFNFPISIPLAQYTTTTSTTSSTTTTSTSTRTTTTTTTLRTTTRRMPTMTLRARTTLNPRARRPTAVTRDNFGNRFDVSSLMSPHMTPPGPGPRLGLDEDTEPHVPRKVVSTPTSFFEIGKTQVTSTVKPLEVDDVDRDGPHHDHGHHPTPSPVHHVTPTTPVVVTGTFTAELPGGVQHHVTSTPAAYSPTPDPAAFFAPILDAAVTTAVNGINSYKQFKVNKVNTIKELISTPAGYHVPLEQPAVAPHYSPVLDEYGPPHPPHPLNHYNPPAEPVYKPAEPVYKHPEPEHRPAEVHYEPPSHTHVESASPVYDPFNLDPLPPGYNLPHLATSTPLPEYHPGPHHHSPEPDYHSPGHDHHSMAMETSYKAPPPEPGYHSPEPSYHPPPHDHHHHSMAMETNYKPPEPEYHSPHADKPVTLFGTLQPTSPPSHYNPPEPEYHEPTYHPPEPTYHPPEPTYHPPEPYEPPVYHPPTPTTYPAHRPAPPTPPSYDPHPFTPVYHPSHNRPISPADLDPFTVREVIHSKPPKVFTHNTDHFDPVGEGVVPGGGPPPPVPVLGPPVPAVPHTPKPVVVKSLPRVTHQVHHHFHYVTTTPVPAHYLAHSTRVPGPAHISTYETPVTPVPIHAVTTPTTVVSSLPPLRGKHPEPVHHHIHHEPVHLPPPTLPPHHPHDPHPKPIHNIPLDPAFFSKLPPSKPSIGPSLPPLPSHAHPPHHAVVSSLPRPTPTPVGPHIGPTLGPVGPIIGFHHPNPFLHPTLPHLKRISVTNETSLAEDDIGIEIIPAQQTKTNRTRNFLKTPVPRVVTTTTTQSSQHFIGPQLPPTPPTSPPSPTPAPAFFSSTPNPFNLHPSSTPNPFNLHPSSTPNPFNIHRSSTPNPFNLHRSSTPNPFNVHPSSTPSPSFFPSSTHAPSFFPSSTAQPLHHIQDDEHHPDDIQTGVLGPHLPMTKDLDIRHDGDPSPNPIHRRQTHVQVTELPFYHSTVFTTPAPPAQAKEDVETYFHDGYQKQYKVLDRNSLPSPVTNLNNPQIGPEPPSQPGPRLDPAFFSGMRSGPISHGQTLPVSSRRAGGSNSNEYSVSLENGHSYFKIGSPSEGNIKVVRKENGFTQRELRKINENNREGERRVSEPEPEPAANYTHFDKDNDSDYRGNDDQYDDYESLIRQGTMTEFLKL